MINLIPPVHKESILYARRNTYLIRWLLGIASAALLLVFIVVGNVYYLRADTSSVKAQTSDIDKQLIAEKQEETIARVNELSGNIKLVVSVLSNEVLFSKLLREIGGLMPPGTALRGLTLDSSLSGGLDLQIAAKSYESAVQAQVNLTDGQKGIFSDADITNTSCEGEDPDYPCTITLRVLFSNEKSNFMKISQEKQ